MRKILKSIIASLSLLLFTLEANAEGYIRVNYAGYLPEALKVAVYILEDDSPSATYPARVGASGQAAWVKMPSRVSYASAHQNANNGMQLCDEYVISQPKLDLLQFSIYDAITDEVVFTGRAEECSPSKWELREAYRLDFSDFKTPGGYYIEFKGVKSPVIKIGADVYDGIADMLLYYMRQQQCGYNPFVDTLCHQHDGYIVDHPTRSGEAIDVRGGWHDASDFLQYQTTSATATYQMLFAYRNIEDKSLFKDNFDAFGRVGSNGIPDILDQAKWGLDWLLKMNPDDGVMFTQIADDRDHIGFKPPQYDSADYGWGAGMGRPVYFLTGKPQGMGKYGKNRTTGVSSAAGKFASSFALGAEVFREFDHTFSVTLLDKANKAYNFAKENPGNTQTACYVSPYFYEEDSWVDDVELAAASLYSATKIPGFRSEADYYGELEPVSPWMELGRGRHYQFYPFINLGHYILAGDKEIGGKYAEFMKEGLQDLLCRAGDDPFLHGVPYLWCSNNLTSAAVTQAELYRRATGDSTYAYMEAALRDWLLGCNPWGVSMIIGYPKGGTLPTDPHSVFTLQNREVTGGLIDGPVYKFIFEQRAGSGMRNPDKTPLLNKGIAVYHNDIGDYATNEPTMDGTASLTYYFATLEQEGNLQKEKYGVTGEKNFTKDSYGVIRRMDRNLKRVYLVFTADSMFNGGEKILKTLEKEGVKGSFFLTGNCLRLREHHDLISRIVHGGHYVGGHSDGHLLYAPWGEDRDTSLVTPDSLLADLRLNATELARFGVDRDESRWFLPPYEHYNTESVNILERAGYKVINYTEGTATPADYTIPSMSSYKGAEYLIKRLYEYEEANTLNGAIILIHPGIEESRPPFERLYNHLGEIIEYLKEKGYSFGAFNEF